MTAAKAFLKDILRHPDDDTPRLIFADWLEDQGDPDSLARSEFIRIQCRLAQGSGGRGERARLDARQDQLLEQHGATWAGPIDRLVLERTFHRGFIDTVSLEARVLLSHPRKLFRLAPIQHLSLRLAYLNRVGGADLAGCSYLQRLISLDLSGVRMDSTSLQALAASEYLTRLRHLELGGNRIGGGGIRALIQAPVFAQLTHLGLRDNSLDGVSARLLGQALLELAERGELVMQCLDLRDNAISWMARRALTSSPILRKVVRLD